MFSPGGNGRGCAGPLGSRQKREGNGELKSAVISFSFITPEFFRLEGKWKVAAERAEPRPACKQVGVGRVFETNPTSTNKRISYIFKHGHSGRPPTGHGGEIRRFLVTRRERGRERLEPGGSLDGWFPTTDPGSAAAGS